MAGIDKAAIAWTIAIVAVGVGIASIGGQFQSPIAPVQTAPQVMEKESPIAPVQTAPQVMEKESPATMMEKTSTPVMKEPTGPTKVEVSIPTGTSVPGCEETKKCFIPSSVSIMKGDTVVWTNNDSAAHTVTSGSPTNGPSGMFDSSLLIGGNSFEHTFDSVGSVDYFCMVHPWMTGNVKVS